MTTEETVDRLDALRRDIAELLGTRPEKIYVSAHGVPAEIAHGFDPQRTAWRGPGGLVGTRLTIFCAEDPCRTMRERSSPAPKRAARRGRGTVKVAS